jgi:nucleotidyltransferase/DNA polymerase involved in DNA repair
MSGNDCISARQEAKRSKLAELTSTLPRMDTARCVVHLDLDGFYAQCEEKRLGVGPETPLAVQQWGALIAMNYAAKRAGISRMMSAVDAKKACPSLVLAHVETIDASGEVHSAAVEDSRHHKVSLERYRLVSQKIFALLAERVGEHNMERASVDECFIDATEAVAQRIDQLPEMTDWELQPHWFVIGTNDSIDAARNDLPFDPSHIPSNRVLWEGMLFAAELREAIAHELGYSSSAGVAHNKLLAKLSSAMNKPAKQTAVPAQAVARLMRATSFRKLRGLGRKLGSKVESVASEDSSAWQVAEGGVEPLLSVMDAKTADWVVRRCRGECNEEIESKMQPKSLLAAKSFSDCPGVEQARGWIKLLCNELGPRLVRDRGEHQRRPRNLVLHFRPKGKTMRSVSERCPRALYQAIEQVGETSPPAKDGLSCSVETTDKVIPALMASVEPLLSKVDSMGAFPCSGLALSANSFFPVQAAGASVLDQIRAAKRPASEDATEPSAGKEAPPAAKRVAMIMIDGRISDSDHAAGPGTGESGAPPPVVAASRVAGGRHRLPIRGTLDQFAVPASILRHTPTGSTTRPLPKQAKRGIASFFSKPP